MDFFTLNAAKRYADEAMGNAGGVGENVVTGEVVTQITDMATNSQIPTAWAVKSLVNSLFEVVSEGTVELNTTDEEVTTKVKLNSRGLYLIALNNTGIPEDGYYFCNVQGNTAELHTISADDTYSKATVAFEVDDNIGGIYVTIYSNEASAMKYKIYKLPFYAE